MNLRLPDGSRMAALIPPVVNPRPMMTIRKFTSRAFTMDNLIQRKMLTKEQADTLAVAVQRGNNILISGGTGSGKTTILNVLAGFIPSQERILVLEDAAELYIRKPHVISAEAQLDTHKTQIGFADLLKAALRHRPDRIIVGEIREDRSSHLLGRIEYRSPRIVDHDSCQWGTGCVAAPVPACHAQFRKCASAGYRRGVPAFH